MNKAKLTPQGIEVYTFGNLVSTAYFKSNEEWNKGITGYFFDADKCNKELVNVVFAQVKRANREGKKYLELYPKG